MDLNKVANAERYLEALDNDYKNWHASRTTVGELLALVREGNKEVGELEKTKTRLGQEIKDLGRQLEEGKAESRKRHEAVLQEYDAKEKEVGDKIAEADKRVVRANKTVEDAEKAATTSQAKLTVAEAKLLAVERKIEEANQLLAKLTQVGA